MAEGKAQAAAQRLAEARRARRSLTLKEFVATSDVATIADAYAVQQAFREVWPDRIAGWKIGATSRPIMQRFGLSEPMSGPIYSADVFESPARIPLDRFTYRTLETEFAYRLGSDLPVRATPWTRAELLDAVDAVVPVFELINPRFDQIPFDRVTLAIADCGLNGGLVTGKPIRDWRGLDLPRHPVRLLVHGELKGEGTGADALDDPANVLEWVANKLRSEGIGLQKGQLISTGTCTGVVHIEPGVTAIGDFGALGQVEVTFA
jgi:2-keto-4-pentenoate hydratase